MTSRMGISWQRIPSAFASTAASACDAADVNGDGMETPTTCSGPSASAAMHAVSAESMPPESPSTTVSNPFFTT